MGDATLFVGRTVELTELRRNWIAASSGECRTVLISGPAGIGKSSLVAAFLESISPVSLWFLTGDEYEHDLPYAAVDQLVNRGTRAPDVLPSFWDSPHSAGVALLRVIASSPGPALLFVDDLHLVDRESVVALLFALRRVPGERLLVLCTLRAEDLHTLPPGVGRLAQTSGAEIILKGLSVGDVIALAAAAGHGRLPARAAARIHEHTAGNPLHLRALLRELTDQQLRSDALLPAPGSFALLVLATLSSLSPASQALAAAAAVLPDGAGVSQLGTVAEVVDPTSGLEELHLAGLLRTHGTGVAATVQFHHPLIRAAVRDDIGPARRTMLHRRAAAVSRGEQALQHLTAAATGPDPELVARLRESAAGHQAAARWRSAATNLRAAARLSADLREREELTLAAADSLLVAGDVMAATQLSDDLENPQPTVRRLIVQARRASLRGDHDAAKDLAEQAWADAAHLDTATRDAIAAMLTEYYLTMDRAAAGLAWADRALASGWLPTDDAHATRGARATALGMLGRSRDGLSSIDDMPDDPLDLPPAERDRARHRGTLRLWAGELDGAIEDLQVASGAPEFRLSPYAIVSAAPLVDAYFRVGRWDECGELIDRAVSLIEDTDQTWFASFIHAHAALVPAARGEWDAAEQALRRSFDAMQVPTPALTHFLSDAIVHVAACQGDWPNVITLGGVMRGGHGAATQPGIFRWPVRYAEALVCTGAHTAADRWLSTLEEQARPQRHRPRLAGIARIRAELASARRDHRLARAAYREAVDLADGVDALEHATAMLGYGRYLRRRGERRAAREQLTCARTRAQTLGAAPLVAACDTELAASGLTSVPDQRERIHGLTPQERTIAHLVCCGKTNREIATELVLSPKTIDYHLNNVYRKLDVHSRSQLLAFTTQSGESGFLTRG